MGTYKRRLTVPLSEDSKVIVGEQEVNYYLSEVNAVNGINKLGEYEDIFDKVSFNFTNIVVIMENKKFYYRNMFYWDDPNADGWKKEIYEKTFEDKYIFFGKYKMLIINYNGWDPVIEEFPYKDYGKWWAVTKEDFL